jgi:hypothetical protein
MKQRRINAICTIAALALTTFLTALPLASATAVRPMQAANAQNVELVYYPDTVYVIVSLLDPARPVLRGFRIVEGRVSEEEIAVAGISSGAAPSAT